MKYVAILKETAEAFASHQCARMAAALAYYTLFSLAPLLVIVMAVCGLLFDASDVRGQVATELGNIVGKDGAGQIQEMVAGIDETDPGGVASVLGLFVLLFGATGVMGQLQEALNQVWNVPSRNYSGVRHFFTKRLMSLAMLLGVAFILIVSLLLSWALRAVGDTLIASQYLPGEVSSWVWIAGHELTLLVIVTFAFAAMFKFLPDIQVSWGDVWLGALTTALLFVLGKSGIGIYLGSRDLGTSYGAAGSLVLILVWVYYSAMIFLLGAEFTQVCSRRRTPAEPLFESRHLIKS